MYVFRTSASCVIERSSSLVCLTIKNRREGDDDIYMIDVCCGLSASPMALFVPPVNPCTCTLVAMLVLAGCLALSFSIFFALSGVAVTHIVLRGITITLVARTLRSVVVVACTKTTNVGRRDRSRREQRGAGQQRGIGLGRVNVDRGTRRERTTKCRRGHA